MKFKITAAAILLASTTVLAACGEAEAPVAEEPAGVAGMTVTNARMILNAVDGNPAAVYFDLAYDGDRNTSLRKAEVAGAESTMMHDYGEWEGKMQMAEMGPLMLQPGDKVSFEPGGKHVMVMGPSAEMKPGGTADVTITVIGGKTFTFPAEIKAAGSE